ncbi:glycosyltransferase [Curtobacterium pusillum]|uniref:glycosyltransferase n=1 Tax=Curtobacterium pusillum TaxID=69373 RepID=UPI0011A22047|nr:glycosyltransferase [Curtobacterium pusillum]
MVVDSFVGRHETVIGDWGSASPHSLRSVLARLVDRVAIHLADLALIDTEVRAQRLRTAHGLPRSRVLSIAVGAPSWAMSTAIPATRDYEPLRVLYYGWYIPLHGVPTVVKALAATTRDIRLTLVGEADHAGGVRDTRALARALAVDGRCHFLDAAVSSKTLASLVAEADVVLGVFGGSVKAAGVIPNKVWQGLAMGRAVVTRQSPALAALSRRLPPGQLVTVPPEDPKTLARALDVLADAPRQAFPGSRTIIDELVERDCSAFIAAINALVQGGRNSDRAQG